VIVETSEGMLFQRRSLRKDSSPGCWDLACSGHVDGAETYLEAVVRELRAVFDAYGIGVDARHLFLIADYMTQDGGLRGLNRAGIQASGSPYLKMSFETCAAFLVDALMTGARDNLRSPSARLVMGRVVDSGTGVCDLWAPL
jgi:DNA-directed RNA polymerase I subunit RPA1